MIKIINKFLLGGDKLMSEIHLRHPRYTYSAFGSYIKSKERIYKFKATGDSNYIHQSE